MTLPDYLFESLIGSVQIDVDMRDQHILITGGAGFIGSTLANRLVDKNDVTVVDNQYLGDKENLNENVNYVESSVLESDLPTNVDIVFHLAALSSITQHEQDIDHTRKGVEINVEGFVNVVEQSRQSGCDSIVYASSSAVYGNRPGEVSEGDPVKATNAYAASKLSREAYADCFANAYGMNMAGMRFFSVYQEPEYLNQEPREASNIITKLAADIAKGRDPEIFGDGKHQRDFIHVEDVARGLVMAADNRLSGRFNLGTGKSYSINDIIDMLSNEFDEDVDPRYIKNPIPDHMFIEDLVADYSRMKKSTGWEPTVELKDGISRVADAFHS